MKKPSLPERRQRYSVKSLYTKIARLPTMGAALDFRAPAERVSMTFTIPAKWLVPTVAMLGVFGGGFGWLPRQRVEASEGFASAKGRIEAPEYEIIAERGGRLAKVFVHEGDRVEDGQIVAAMESGDLRQEQEHPKSRLWDASEQLFQATMVMAEKKSALEKVKVSLEQREREFVFAQRELERSRELVAKDLIARQEVNEREGKLRVAEAALALDRTRNQAADAAFRAAEYQVKEKKAAMDALQAGVEKTRPETEDRFLRAPHRGVVIARAAEPGEILIHGSRVFRVLEMEPIAMTVLLPGEQAQRITVGSEARLLLDAARHSVFPGVVASVEPQAEFAAKKADAQREKEQSMFRVSIKINARLIEQHLKKIKTGLTGVVYMRLDPYASWPEFLQIKSP